MVDNLLYTYRHESGTIELKKDWFNINESIESCYKELKYLIETKKQEVILDFQSADLQVYADIMEIKRVITNLFSNAVNYTQENGKIIVRSEIKDNNALISFIDNGKGISKEDLAELFFKYKSNAKKFKQIGTGLGLYLSKKIIESHSGTITVESIEGKGSKFSFTVPLTSSPVKSDNSLIKFCL